MKLVLICNSDISNKKKSLFQSFNIDVIKYSNPLKAMDNFREIAPHMVYFVKDDFPRTWKIVLSALREYFNKDSSCFILESSSVKDDKKEFEYLNGNIIIEEDKLLEVKDFISKTYNLNFKPIFIPDSNNFFIGFVKPETFSFISAEVITINDSNLIFTIDVDEYEDLKPNTTVKNASIEINNQVISLDFSVDKIENNRYFTTITNESEKLKTLLTDLFV